MPRFKIVIDNPTVAHEQEIERNIRANIHAHGVNRMGAAEAVRAVSAITRKIRASVGPERPAGTIHAEADTDCPDGLPNCRNCGDPEHAETCKAAGHCPDCGTKHGIAPDRIVAAHGYRLEPE
jgi:hypothetical protein